MSKMFILLNLHRIEKIEHLDSVPNLQMLYLQNNRIAHIENLGHLKKLKKLYLSSNKISVVENLEGLKNLRGESKMYHCYLYLITLKEILGKFWR